MLAFCVCRRGRSQSAVHKKLATYTRLWQLQLEMLLRPDDASEAEFFCGFSELPGVNFCVHVEVREILDHAVGISRSRVDGNRRSCRCRQVRVLRPGALTDFLQQILYQCIRSTCG
jgi:hypothetical protein